MTNKFILGGVILSLVFSIFAVFNGPAKSGSSSFLGVAAGNLLAENYIPYIQYNGGFNTAKSIKTTDDLSTATLQTTGASTFGGAVTVTTTNAATSTVSVGCIQTTATSTATAIKLTFGNGVGAGSAATTTFGSNGTVGLVAWTYGSCPNF